MSKVELLASALEYIELHLTEDMKTEDIAKAVYCSKSTLEKLFQGMNHMSIHDYVVRRRMNRGAKLLFQNEELSILDAALQVGYNSHESFTRAFKQVWNCNPSEFRGRTRYSEIFPRLYPPIESGDEYMKERRHVDISELYDLIVERKSCYYICSDIKRLVPINEISHKAGDLAILESMNRLNDVAGEDDVVFRIGGDEFVLLTASEDKAYAEGLVEKILAKNGETFRYEDMEIPLSLYAVASKLELKHVKYNEVFKQLHETIQEHK